MTKQELKNRLEEIIGEGVKVVRRKTGYGVIRDGQPVGYGATWKTPRQALEEAINFYGEKQ